MTAVLAPEQLRRIADLVATLTRGNQVTAANDRAALAKAAGVLRGAASSFKRCPRCGRVRPIGQFGANHRKSDGRKGWCRDCEAAHAADRRSGARRLPTPIGAVTVCICAVAHPGAFGGCQRCGLPVVATMAPRLQEAMAAKYPPISDQLVIWPEPAEVAS